MRYWKTKWKLLLARVGNYYPSKGESNGKKIEKEVETGSRLAG